MDNNGGWRAWVVIPNIQFNYTGSYGIRLEPQQHNLPTVENSVSVEVVGKDILI